MGNNGCVNGSLDGVNYSSPVPIIGVYIFLASLACVVVMLYDVVVAGIIPRKRWLPCKYFQLNSVTLTLLAVATKLPVDLTTSMPGPHDQLSKLTGTAIICISMGFLAPSLGANGESECFTNMVALSIFVVTVAANIIIQLCTGVIVLFFVEHIIMLILMLLLLLMLWQISFYIKVEKRIDTDQYNNLLSKGEAGSMFQRLKSCYAYAYCSNPQFRISMYSMNVAVSSLSLGCCGIIVETTFRSLILKKLEFCGGDSDYSWSMKFIVYTQIAAVLIATVAIIARCLSLFSRMDLDSILVSFLPDAEEEIQRKQTLRAKGLTRDGLSITFETIIKYIITKVVLVVQLIIVYPIQLVRDDVLGIKKDDNILVYIEGVGVTGYIVRKSLDDMIRLRNRVAGPGSEYRPSQYLRRDPSPFRRRSDGMVIKEGVLSMKVSSLSVALLVKVAEAFIPRHYHVSLLDAFHEARDVLHFIDQAMQPKNTENNDRLAYAKALWIGGGFTRVLPDHVQPGEDYNAAIDSIRELQRRLHSGDIWADLGIVIDFILCGNHSSVEDLYFCMEELFVDMLHVLYAQLPVAICKSLRASPAEEFEESVRVAMGFLFRIGSLDCQNDWVFSEGMSCIVPDEATTSRDAPAELTGQLLRLRDIRLDRQGEAASIRLGHRGRASIHSNGSSV